MGMRGGEKGSQNGTYWAALELLQRRKDKGLKDPTQAMVNAAKKRKAEESDTCSQPAAKKAANSGKGGLVDVSEIHLPGEETDSVGVYETPREVRRKINALLKEPSVTQAGFLRLMGSQFNTGERKFQGVQLTRFRGYKGVIDGVDNGIFYAAYVYFEKLRIKEGKPKSKHRLEMEKIHFRDGGLSLRPNRGYWSAQDMEPVINEYGQVSLEKIR